MKDNIVEFGDSNITSTTFKWNITDVCNYNCSYCNAIPVNGFHKKHFSESEKNRLSAWKNVIKRLSVKAVGAFDIQILGGEPTLHPDFHVIIDNLCDNINCTEIEIYTNLSRPESFWKTYDQPKHSKIILIPAYHYEYYRPSFSRKIVSIFSNPDINVRIEPVINLSTRRQDWDNIISLINVLKDNNIRYRLNFLHPVEEPIHFKPVYTDEFWDIFHDILIEEYQALMKLPNQKICSNKIDVKSDRKHIKNVPPREVYIMGGESIMKDTSGDTITMLERDVVVKKLNMFKGWSCRTQIYYIDPDGIIVNDCTQELLPAFFTHKDLAKYRNCPEVECDRMSFIYFNKMKYHRKKQ